MKASNVRQLMAEKRATPDAANRLLSILSILMEIAIALGWRDDNPAVGKRLKHHGTGFATWAEADIAVYRNYYPLGTRERLVLELALGTAQRRGDLVRLGWRHVINGAIAVKQSKTGAEIKIPIVRELHAALELCPRDRLTIIAQADGRPLAVSSLGNDFHVWLRKGWASPEIVIARAAQGRREALGRGRIHRARDRGRDRPPDACGSREILPGGREDAARRLWDGKGCRNVWEQGKSKMSDEHDGPSAEEMEQFSRAVYEATMKTVQQLAIKEDLCVRCYSPAIRSGLLHAMADMIVSIGEGDSPTQARKYAETTQKHLYRLINSCRDNNWGSGTTWRDSLQ
jgi:hypothetical protein